MILKIVMCTGLLALLSLPKTTADKYPLYVGQHTQVGNVTVTPADYTGDNIIIKYEMEDGWCATGVHIHANKTGDPIPVNKASNPKVGLFEINESQGCSSEGEFTTAGKSCGEPIEIAFHADVANVGDSFLRDLPITDGSGSVDVVSHPGTNNGLKDSYWDIEIEGMPYDAWCVDLDRFMSPGATYDVSVYSSLDEDLPFNFDEDEHPENFPKVNWILNQEYVGTASGCYGGSTYTLYDVQEAIWRLIEDNTFPNGNIGDDCRVTEIVNAAADYGEFEPGCGDDVAVVLIPTEVKQVIIAQVIVAEVEVSCGHDTETAWAAMPGGGIDFPTGKSWATYITYTKDCPRLLRGV